MLLQNAFITATLLVSTTTAFYPWFPGYRCVEDHTCVAERSTVDDNINDVDATLKLVQRVPYSALPRDVQIQRLAARLTRKYQRGTLFQPLEVIERDNVEKRSNTYSVMAPAIPSQSMSAGIYQDGTDFSYFVQASLGSSNTPMYMLLDTGAATTWVMGKTCTSDPCKIHNAFDSSSSASFKSIGQTFNISYGSGQVSGMLGTDSVSFAGMTLGLTLGVADTASNDFNSFPIDGILGLSQSKTGNNPNFLQTLVASKSLTSNLFGVSINRAADGANTGEINFGSPDTTKFSGSLNYNAVSSAGDGDWSIPIGNIGLGTNQANIKNRLAYIDTGTSFIFCPPEDAKTFHAMVPGASTTNGVTYTIPCTTSTILTFTFGSTTYNVDPKDWVSPMANGVCTSNMYGQAVVPDNWLLGDTFLKNVYAVFDVDKNRIGLAQKNTASAPTSASSMVPTSSTTSAPSSSSGMATSSTGPGTTSATVTSSDRISTGTLTATSPGPSSSSSGVSAPVSSSSGSANPSSSSTSSTAAPPASPGLNGHETSPSDPASQTAAPTASPSSTRKSDARRLLANILPTTFGIILIALIS